MCIRDRVLITYTQWAVAATRYFTCVQVGASKVVYFWPAIACEGSDYTAGAAGAAICLAYLVTVPIVIFVWLFHHRRSLASASRNGSAPAWYVFCEPYKALPSDAEASMSSQMGPAIWGASYVLIRRLLVSICDAALTSDPPARFLCFAVLHVFYYAVHVQIKPYAKTRALSGSSHTRMPANLDNHLESMVLLLLACTAMMLSVYPPPLRSREQVALIFLVMLPSLGLLLFSSIRFIYARARLFRLKTLDSASTTESLDHSNPVYLTPLPYRMSIIRPVSVEASRSVERPAMVETSSFEDGATGKRDLQH